MIWLSQVRISLNVNQKEDYQELGGSYFDELDREQKEHRLVRQLEKLGFEVALTPASSQA